MKRFYPNIYQKNIFDINYNLLIDKNIKCLVFDLDNTIALIDQDYVDSRTKTLFKELENNFKIFIVSNNSNKKRVASYAKNLNCSFYHWAWKPSKKTLKKIMKKYNFKQEEIAVIGDQLVTDIFMGNRNSSTTILIDPIGDNDLKITSLNRYLERKILKKYAKKNIFKKGEYYE